MQNVWRHSVGWDILDRCNKVLEDIVVTFPSRE